LARALVIALVTVVALELVYVVAANVALYACSSRFASRAPFAFSYDRGTSVFPGRFHFRGLRVSGTSGGGFAATTSECDVVAMSPEHVSHVSADVTAIDLAGKRITGTLHVDARDITIDGDNVSLDADAKTSATQIEIDHVTFASDVTGTISAHIDGADFAKGNALDKTSATVDLSGKFLSLAPLASLGSLVATQDPGTLRIVGSSKSGVVQPASELRADTTHATLNDARGALVDFPRGLTIAIAVSAAPENLLRGDVRATKVVFQSADASRPPDVFDDFDLTAPLGDLPVRSLAWSSGHVVMHEGASTLTAKASGALHFTPSSAGVVADVGNIEASNVVIENAKTTDRSPFDASMEIDHLVISRADGIAFGGRMHASGEDARPIFELLVSSPRIRGALGSLGTKPFTVDATLERRDGRVAIDDLVMRSGSLSVRGAYHRRENESRAAFVASGGPIPVGVAQKNATESLVVAPPSGWLATELRTVHAIDETPGNPP
jgi:hypothetical protein